MPPQPETPPSRVRWHEVTWYSKLAAIIVFLGAIPVLSFYIGTQYQQTLALFEQSPVTQTNMSVKANETPSFPYSSTTEVVLGGTLEKRQYYGSPNYGENPETDTREEAVILRLAHPFNVGGAAPITEIQLSYSPSKIDISGSPSYRFVTGTLRESLIGHEHTPVVFDVQKISIPVQVLDDVFATDGTYIYSILDEVNDPPAKLGGVDAKTFRLRCLVPNVPDNEYSCDATRLISRGLGAVIMGDYDLGSLQAYADDTHYFKDRKSIYRLYHANFLSRLEGADLATFRTVSGQRTYDAEDKNRRYYCGYVVEPGRKIDVCY